MPPRRRAARRTARRTSRRTTHRVMRRHRRRRRRRVIVGGAILVTAGAAAYGAYKLSQPDVEKIEEYTGSPVEELDDDELQSAMQNLNIQPEEMTEEDKAAMATSSGTPSAQPQAQPPTQPAARPAAPAPAAPQDDYIAELENLADLRDKGIITDEEFEAKKKILLGI